MENVFHEQCIGYCGGSIGWKREEQRSVGGYIRWVRYVHV
jgi:hypothetical protein